MKSEFSGRVVLVAGGTGGLGRAVSLAFLSAGDHVAVTYRNDDELATLSAAAGENVSRLSGHKIDVTLETDVRDLVSGLVEAHGALDVLVNTVGGYGGRLEALGTGSGTSRQDAESQPALGLRPFARGRAGDAEAGTRHDRQRRRPRGVRERRRAFPPTPPRRPRRWR